MSHQHSLVTQKGLEEDMPTDPHGAMAPGAGSTLGRRIIASIIMSLKVCPFLGPCLEGH